MSRIAAKPLLPIVLVTLLGAAIRIAQLDQNLWGDEMWGYFGATSAGVGGMLDWVRSDQEITPPLFTALAWLSGKAFGDGATALRLPSLLAGIATIPLVYAIGVRTVGRGAALVAATLAALSPFLAWYSIELRAYSLTIMLTAAATLSLLVALQGRRVWWWVAYGLLACAAMYTHYTAIYVLVAGAVWALAFHPESRRPLLLAAAGAAVLYIPWVPFLLDDFDAPSQQVTERIAPFGFERTLDFTARTLFSGPLFTVGQLLGSGWVLVLCAGLLLGIGGLAVRWSRSGGPSPSWDRLADHRNIVLIVMLALAAPAGAILISLLGDNQYLPRNIATSLPAMLLGVAAIVYLGWPRPIAIVATALVAAAFVFGAVRGLEPDFQRAGYDDAAEFIDAEAGPNDVVLDLSLSWVDAPEKFYPPAETLAVAFDHPHQVIAAHSPRMDVEAFLAARGARLFLLGPPGFPESTERYLGLDDETPVAERSIPGSVPLTVRVFPVARDARPARPCRGLSDLECLQFLGGG
jgi:hypothetical protein